MRRATTAEVLILLFAAAAVMALIGAGQLLRVDEPLPAPIRSAPR